MKLFHISAGGGTLFLLSQDTLIPRSIIYLEKLMFAHLIKKFPTFYGTQKIIAVITRSRHWTLFWAGWIQSNPLHPISFKISFSSLLSSQLRFGLPSDPFLSCLPTEILYAFLIFPTRATLSDHLIYFYFIILIVFDEDCRNLGKMMPGIGLLIST